LNVKPGSLMAMAAKPEAEPRDPLLADFLYKLLRGLKERGMTQREIAIKTKVSAATISNILNGAGKYGVGRDVAEDLGKPFAYKSYDEILDAAHSARLERLKSSVGRVLEPARVSMPARSFLLKLRRLPGLERWAEDYAGDLSVFDLARGIAEYDNSPPRSREDGQPFGGWDAFFADVKAGRLTGPKKLGDQSAAEALETNQLPPSTRGRLPPDDDRSKGKRNKR
jgi:transcriptional regulator with XRE-family HTH domain